MNLYLNPNSLLNFDNARDYYNYSDRTVSLQEEDRSQPLLNFYHATDYFGQDTMPRGIMLERARAAIAIWNGHEPGLAWHAYLNKHPQVKHAMPGKEDVQASIQLSKLVKEFLDPKLGVKNAEAVHQAVLGGDEDQFHLHAFALDWVKHDVRLTDLKAMLLARSGNVPVRYAARLNGNEEAVARHEALLEACRDLLGAGGVKWVLDLSICGSSMP